HPVIIWVDVWKETIWTFTDRLDLRAQKISTTTSSHRCAPWTTLIHTYVKKASLEDFSLYYGATPLNT
ncbi:Hypothetical protein FKW44_012544, partial [Caligus rogercresseyi]